MITRDGNRVLLEGPLRIGTVSALLAQSRALLAPGVAVLNFKGVTEVDSAAAAVALAPARSTTAQARSAACLPS